MTIPNEGFHFGVPESDYRAWPACNYSALKILVQGGTPAHYRALLDSDDEDSGTKAQTFGRLAHRAILEPDRLDSFRQLPENIKRRTGKDWVALCSDNPGITFLPPAEWSQHEQQKERAKRLRDGVMQNPILADIIGRAKPEVSMLWTDKDTGLRCKARMDLFTGNEIGDIKTTSLNVPYQIARSAYKYGYHIQVAMYTDGASLLLGRCCELKPIPFWFIFIETNEPHLVSVYNGHAAYDERSDRNDPHGFLKIGRDAYKAALRTVKECEQSGEWDGHPLEPLEMAIPKYAGWENVEGVTRV